MITIGIDPGSKRLAFASLADSGAITHRVHTIPDVLRGAQRLHMVRDVATRHMATYEDDIAVVCVEIPWASKDAGSSFVLLSIAGILMEAAQHVHPGAVVLDVPTQTWKRDSVGNGNASKSAVMDHARGLGLDVADQDIADALCMAQAGWTGWQRHSTVAA